MRVIRFLLCCIIICLASFIIVSATDTGIFEWFETSDSLWDWNLVPKQGNIVISGEGEAGCVQIDIPPQSEQEKDAFLQSRVINGNSGFEVAGKMRLLSEEGDMQMVLRDTSAVLEGHYISLARLGPEQIVFFPDVPALRKVLPAIRGEDYNISAVFDLSSDSFKVYCSNSLVVSAHEITGSDTANFKEFLFDSFFVRLQAVTGENIAVKAQFDDVRLHRTAQAGDKIIASDPWLEYTGIDEVFAVAAGVGVQGEDGDMLLICAVYENARLKSIEISQPQRISGGEMEKVKVQINQKSIAAGNCLKLMAISSSENIKPLANVRICDFNNKNTVTSPEPLELRVRLNQQHPRVMLTQDKLMDIRRNTVGTSNVAQWYQVLKTRADRYLTLPLPEYEDDDPIRLTASSAMLTRIWELSISYCVSGDEKYARRIWDLLERGASWPDWGNTHFLNTADLCMAYGIAYDWLYDYWDEAQRKFIAETLLNQGLLPAYRDYKSAAPWTKLDSNWTAVCNGGVAVGAIALMGEYALCDEIVAMSLKNVQQCYWQFKPDGGWYEGVPYWDYAMQFWTYMMSSMETAFGTDFGHRFAPGLKETGYFPVYMTGYKDAFNYSDGRQEPIPGASMFYLGKIFQDKNLGGYRFYQLVYANQLPSVSDLLWYDSRLVSLSFRKAGFGSAYYKNIETVVMRNGFLDFTQSCVILHGGKNNISHGHLDAGQFMYEAGGVRWALDLGMEDYSLYNLGVFNPEILKNRWAYYRMRAEGHNLIVVNPDAFPDQAVDGYGVIEKQRFQAAGDSMAVADISCAYQDRAKSVKRGVKFKAATGGVLIQDEIILKKESELYWFMHTAADVSIAADGRSAILTEQDPNGNERKLLVALLTPDATFYETSATPFPSSPNPNLWSENLQPQNSNSGITKLCVRNQNKTGNFTQSVYMVLLNQNGDIPEEYPLICPISEW